MVNVMLDPGTRVLSIAELAEVAGGLGTQAQTVPQAAKNFLGNNGNGGLLQRAGSLGSKVWHRALYSAGVTRTIEEYGNQTKNAIGGPDYVADIERLRPATR